MRPRLLLDISYADLFSVFTLLSAVASPANIKPCLKIFPQSVICLSARSAFHALLQTLALPPAAPIIYSAITIETMVAIAQEHGLTPHFVDVDAATMLLSAADLDALLAKTGAKVVVIAQLFGCVSPLGALGDVCRKHGALLVEDCAQAFSADFHLGDPAADFSLFSFGPIKRFTALGGGIVVGKDKLALDKIAQTIQAWPRKSDAWFFKRTLKFLALKLVSTPLIYTALLRTLSALGKDADALIGSIARGFQAGSITPQLEFQPSPRQRRLLFRRLNAAKHTPARSAAASQVLQTVQKLLPNIAFETLGNAAHKNARWLMPVLVNDTVTHPANIVIQLRQLGFDATQGATSMRAFGDHCAQAQRIMRQVVYLPL
ncbi:MAG: DegT/DnrJ/EryC1/StrS family aminotransferase [Burkholderiaceae bacterium]